MDCMDREPWRMKVNEAANSAEPNASPTCDHQLPNDSSASESTDCQHDAIDQADTVQVESLEQTESPDTGDRISTMQPELSGPKSRIEVVQSDPCV
ncbi:hypothetical protein V6N11_055384 [Hibiscus sabdariffa]|uniref:Uncharacterized protein n=1 Tax=Hibiscus sabdariffa TaxID=183260 RepID=A0ABR2PF87_9ROSI